MSTEPEFLPPFSNSGSQPDIPLPMPAPPPRPSLRLAHTIPNIGHTVFFFAGAYLVLFVTQQLTLLAAVSLHLFGSEAVSQLLHEPRLLVPSMAVSYLAAGLLAWAVFSHLWQRAFPQAIRWNSTLILRRFYLFLGIGILLSVALEFLSSYMPIPKSLPMDDFFRTRSDVWLMVIFGTLIAPVFEELAFRGFLFPSLASAWDWVARRGGTSPVTGISTSEGDPERQTALKDPRWSMPALAFSAILTSIGFALLHSDQLADSWAPLSVLFAVSIVLCLVRLRFHSLAASTLVHASYNGTIFAVMYFATDGFRHLDKMN